jgi:hypothetical protein
VRSVLVAAACAVLLSLAPAAGAELQAERFRGTISRIDAAQAKRMTGVSWRPGCPVHLRDLRLLTLSHRRFDGKTRLGRLIVHADVAREVVDVFRKLYRARFPIRRMVPVDATTRWSEHAYGRAVDVNPIENPYVSGGRTSHRASVTYVDRTRRRPGMAYESSVLVRAFDSIGWGWGGRWASVKDYQHFSASGR